MGIVFTDKIAEVKNIQPYFMLSTRSAYYERAINNDVISHFYTFMADNSEGHTFAVPDACVDMLFLCDTEDPAARICGSPLSAKLVEVKKNKRYFGIRFTPGFTPNLDTIHPRDLIDNELNLKEIIPSTAHHIIEQIAQAKSFNEQINIFTHNYKNYLLIKEASELCQQIKQLIFRAQGDIRISDIETITGFSPRYIYKTFTDQFGFSPKLYCLISRFQNALRNLINDKKISLTELAINLGYADQSHFLREFKKFAAISPKKFLSNIH